jgi:K+-transporting ATPase ATPase A chain
MPQTLDATVSATTLEGVKQTIVVGPVASQVAIKMLGTNGGGFFNANASHPFENPTAVANFIQMLTIFVLGAGLCLTFGKAVGRFRQGWALLAAMLVIFFAGASVVYWAEAGGNSMPWASPGRIWRARNCALAPLPARCSSPSPPMPPAAR